ncbi:Trichothecene 3-o-acetyltransferase [Lasiodiplodia theobromae]|uniref:Spermidine sinapoyl-CoA acyltransferase n=1 Tax=Lasiodiplodia theobromae TaxID=45133 RepID=A0A5N5DRF0_9PEZI|nr:Trichothecene 3-o-acetyltransferase [Lasiodiplodia theobromae]KAB2580485.1 Spermidine sinapoyl-CoA acyltransferase [Lasiodiplodia theobromae]KAF4540157.1 Trichothecene 3-o-acetyltransferase [Lasiodiplodia theobromae]
MGKKEVFNIYPRGWENDPEVENFELSDLDHALPKIYTLLTLTYELDPAADKNKMVQNLREGLEITLGQYRSLAGELDTDPNNGKVWIKRKKGKTVEYIVNDMSDTDEFPSFEALDREDFPAGKMDGDLLLPIAVTQKQPLTPLGEDKDDETPILVAQVNFIRGGIIVAAAIHHCCSDGPGTDGFLAQWAANSHAIATSSALPPFDSSCMDRTPLISHAKPSDEWMAATQRKIRSLDHQKTPPPPPPADFKMPPLSQVMMHFSSSGLAKLKEATKQPGDGSEWVSTYDSIMAVLWRSFTRSRLEMFKPDLESESHLLHAVGIRKAVTPPLPPHFLGNALLLPKPGVPISRLIADETLPQIAGTVRQSIKDYTDPQMIQDTLDWIAGTQDKTWITIRVNGFLGMDVCGTSWGTMTAYERADFGFGLPRALRRPRPTVDGYIFMYPRRPKKVNAEEEGIEVCVCLESSCMERLLKDEELLRFAHPRGL